MYHGTMLHRKRKQPTLGQREGITSKILNFSETFQNYSILRNTRDK